MVDQVEVLLGATSALAQATARELVGAEGVTLILVARDSEKLGQVAADLKARGASVRTEVADLTNTDQHDSLLQQVGEANNWWLFYGTLPDQKACENDWKLTSDAFNVNFLSAASLLERVANRLIVRGRGTIVVISSVAGDRGRQSNYIYGAAKGALSLYCQGLRNRLSKSGISLMTVKPGFIDTPMTAEIPKQPAMLWASPEKVARDMVRARIRGKDVLYTPWFWGWIMLIIRLVPERVFKKLSL